MPLHDWSLAHEAVIISRRYYANSIGYPSRTASSLNLLVACLVRESLSRQAPLYLADDCHLVSDSTRRSLLSADVSTCLMPRTLSSYGDRTFAATGPCPWNSLPVQLLNPDITYGLFRRQMKVQLFGKHEYDTLWLLICSAVEKHWLTCLPVSRDFQPITSVPLKLHSASEVTTLWRYTNVFIIIIYFY